MDQKKNPTKDDFEFLQLNGLLPPEMSYEEYCQQELASENPPSPKEDAPLKETLAEAAPTASNQKGNAPSSMEGRGTESAENALLAEMKKDEEISKAQDSKLIDQGWSEYLENTLKEDERLEAQLRKLAQGANPEAATLLGVAGYYGRLARKQEEKKTLTYLLLGADGGCPEAFALLAEVFYKQKDFAKARSYAEKAQQADQGLGYLYLGVLAGSGEGEPLDIEKAKACFLKARDKGLPRASFCLGLYYWLSPSVKQDADQALFYYKEAAERGWSLAYVKIAEILETEKDDPQGAVEAYRKGVEAKDRNCYIKLANRYRDGKGVKQNIPLAIQLYEEGGELGDGDCYNNLGGLYWSGRGVKANKKKARAYFAKGAELGSETAKKNLTIEN